MKCLVKGHDHELAVVHVSVQRGTGQRADILECPTGNYRWFCIQGNELSDVTRMKRPRFGWKPFAK